MAENEQEIWRQGEDGNKWSDEEAEEEEEEEDGGE